MYDYTAKSKKKETTTFSSAMPIQLIHFEQNHNFIPQQADNELPSLLGNQITVNHWIIPLKNNSCTCASTPLLRGIFDKDGKRIAIHFCFSIKHCFYISKTNTLDICVAAPHYTARSEEQQDIASSVGTSHNVAPNSIHWGGVYPTRAQQKKLSTCYTPLIPDTFDVTFENALLECSYFDLDMAALKNELIQQSAGNIDTTPTVNVSFV